MRALSSGVCHRLWFAPARARVRPREMRKDHALQCAVVAAAAADVEHIAADDDDDVVVVVDVRALWLRGSGAMCPSSRKRLIYLYRAEQSAHASVMV